MAGARSLVVGARSYARASQSPSHTNHGDVARYAWSDYYAELRGALGVIAGRLDEAGWQARVLADDNALVDRAAAYRAGIGWYGKNTNLLLKGRGSMFVLGAVITDAPLPPTEERVADGCGSCTRCITACPTDAIVAPGVLDARRCLAWQLQAPGSFPLEYRVALGGRIYGCDDCQETCPPNQLEIRRRPPPPPAPGAQTSVDLVGLLTASDEDVMVRVGRWYVARRDPRYVRRNALIALGNVGDPRDQSVVDVIESFRQGDDDLLREHADWAAARLASR
jgi:epoxyqueuosine reductase